MVVDVATKLVEAENGRFRFVDYTEKKLVPGAVRGALADKREMAVRDIGECIVGQAALHRSPIFVNDVTKNNYFIQFKNKIKELCEKNLDWKKYYDDTLEYLGSEIATPVVPFQGLTPFRAYPLLK